MITIYCRCCCELRMLAMDRLHLLEFVTSEIKVIRERERVHTQCANTKRMNFELPILIDETSL